MLYEYTWTLRVKKNRLRVLSHKRDGQTPLSQEKRSPSMDVQLDFAGPLLHVSHGLSGDIRRFLQAFSA